MCIRDSTYISVLERKKEIGILRAIGASKGNISQVFNAEKMCIRDRTAGQQNQTQQSSSSGAAVQETARKMFPGGFTVLCKVWLTGIAVSLLYQILCWRRVRKRTGQAVLLEENIYECDSIGSPFVMGIRRQMCIRDSFCSPMRSCMRRA